MVWANRNDRRRIQVSFSRFARPNQRSKAERALEVALEIRKFEIELYWKRAAYFWAFIAASLLAYANILSGKDLPVWEKAEGLITASSLGLVFSTAWYFVNRASKYWQENWETHVDLLEDDCVGPLYKTVAEKSPRFLNLLTGYAFSVSKINQLLSLLSIAMFALLLVSSMKHYVGAYMPDTYAISVLLVTVCAILGLGFACKTDGKDVNKVTLKRRRTRIG